MSQIPDSGRRMFEESSTDDFLLLLETPPVEEGRARLYDGADRAASAESWPLSGAPPQTRTLGSPPRRHDTSHEPAVYKGAMAPTSPSLKQFTPVATSTRDLPVQKRPRHAPDSGPPPQREACRNCPSSASAPSSPEASPSSSPGAGSCSGPSFSEPGRTRPSRWSSSHCSSSARRTCLIKSSNCPWFASAWDHPETASSSFTIGSRRSNERRAAPSRPAPPLRSRWRPTNTALAHGHSASLNSTSSGHGLRVAMLADLSSKSFTRFCMCCLPHASQGSRISGLRAMKSNSR
mmetsp:Transcript_64711/g.172013  ORF Transcript_64711/g.172013 Transcript_64711/m.172013 type:complete len:292 (+) Transcript_64711:58-933(+)